MELRITTLIENEPDVNGNLAYEHGLSLFIEFDGKKLLFDTGQTGDFLENAKKLGKKPEEADAIFVSHGHYDHSGGVPGLLTYLKERCSACAEGNCERKIPLYVGEEFFAPKYKKLPEGTWHYNGNPFSEADLGADFICLHKLTADMTHITDKIIVFKNFRKGTHYERTNPKFYTAKDCKEAVKTAHEQQLVQDEFAEEIALGLVTSKGLVVIVGCSHVGIVNILQTITDRTGLPIYSVLGGTHLVEADADRLQRTAEDFLRLGLKEVAVSHCTGEQGVALLKSEFETGFIRNHTGNVYSL